MPNRFCTIIASLAFAPLASTIQASAAEALLHFSIEGSPISAVRLPVKALEVIARDHSVASVLEADTSFDLSKSVNAFAVKLTKANETDFVVIATGLLAGANVSNFWILRPLNQTYAVVFDAPGHDLYVLDRRSNGYSDISLLSATAVRSWKGVFRFTNGHYALVRWNQSKAK